MKGKLTSHIDTTCPPPTICTYIPIPLLSSPYPPLPRFVHVFTPPYHISHTIRELSLHLPRIELTTFGIEVNHYLHLTKQAIVAVEGVFCIIITYWFQTPHSQSFNLFVHVHRIKS